METSIAKTNEQFPTTCAQPAPAKWSSVTLPFIRKSTQRTIGIQFAKDADGNFRIMAVWSPSPAATAELKIGDLILAVNQLDAREMSLDDLSREIHGHPGTEVNLFIDSGGQRRTVPLEITCLLCASN
jgi:C-terminal processing protease CtpA/Prc